MMANGFSWLIDQLEAQKFTAKDWNPKDNDGNTIKDFKPALIPIAMESLDFLNASSEDSNLSNFINTLEQNLDNFYTNARARLVAYDLGVVTYSQRQIDLIPDSLESNCKGVLLRNLDNIYPNIKALLQQLHNTDLGSLIG
jgi:hypothetical protein